MTASMPLMSLDLRGRAMRAQIDLVTLPNIGERVVLTFHTPTGEDPLFYPVPLMPCDARALAKALEAASFS
ncbi:hypothetical protein [Limnohabitans sp.]|jgi:hypothetical protein|uniref:hypothetical protein n=1 Tax=Limnohabitans sp. TaxID=1907725 RepID=UPI00286F72ED|nr:hypothetical protein [Limnohabitans sp.]